MSGDDEGGTGTSYGFYPIVRPGLRPGSDSQFEWEPENGDWPDAPDDSQFDDDDWDADFEDFEEPDFES